MRRVPNWLVVAGAGLAITALGLGAGPLGHDWRAALFGAGAGFGFLLLFYATGLMGAGDVKFASALGLWVGLPALAPIWIGASLIAGIHSVLWLALRRWPFFSAARPDVGWPVARSRTRHLNSPDTRHSLRGLPRLGRSGMDGLGATELATADSVLSRRPFISFPMIACSPPSVRRP
ncbi:prepilin peptidase [Variovorax boronicumulans]|uniref:A24 family peptidase n=1 Tax=Variovorax boronicumulans TaxID=436515 RepID=UPI0036F261DB